MAYTYLPVDASSGRQQVLPNVIPAAPSRTVIDQPRSSDTILTPEDTVPVIQEREIESSDTQEHPLIPASESTKTPTKMYPLRDRTKHRRFKWTQVTFMLVKEECGICEQ